MSHRADDRSILLLSDEEFVAYLAGFEAGYVNAMTVLDEAGGLLAASRPSRGVDAARIRACRDTYTRPARTAEQIRREACESWALPIRVEPSGPGSGPAPNQARLVQE